MTLKDLQKAEANREAVLASIRARMVEIEAKIDAAEKARVEALKAADAGAIERTTNELADLKRTHGTVKSTLDDLESVRPYTDEDVNSVANEFLASHAKEFDAARKTIDQLRRDVIDAFRKAAKLNHTVRAEWLQIVSRNSELHTLGRNHTAPGLDLYPELPPINGFRLFVDPVVERGKNDQLIGAIIAELEGGTSNLFD